MAMTLFKSKKGMFFTIVAMIFASGLFLFYINSNLPKLSDTTNVLSVRILTMDSFITDIETDIQRGLYITSLRALLGMTEYMASSGEFLPNFTQVFNTTMLTGNITIVSNLTSKTYELNITKNSSFNHWMAKIEEKARYIDIDIQFDNMSIVARQDDPWFIIIDFDATLNLTDKKGLASWKKSINVSTTLSIVNFEDPSYTVTSKGKYTNKIVRSNFTAAQIAVDLDRFTEFVNNSYYIASDTAPSFIMRFEGDFSDSPYGIESIASSNRLSLATGDSYSDLSCVDYLLFQKSPLRNCIVEETKTEFDWLRLDNSTNSHLIKFDKTGSSCTS